MQGEQGQAPVSEKHCQKIIAEMFLLLAHIQGQNVITITLHYFIREYTTEQNQYNDVKIKPYSNQI